MGNRASVLPTKWPISAPMGHNFSRVQHRALLRHERIVERRGGDAILRVNICAAAHLRGHSAGSAIDSWIGYLSRFREEKASLVQGNEAKLENSSMEKEWASGMTRGKL